MDKLNFIFFLILGRAVTRNDAQLVATIPFFDDFESHDSEKIVSLGPWRAEGKGNAEITESYAFRGLQACVLEDRAGGSNSVGLILSVDLTSVDLNSGSVLLEHWWLYWGDNPYALKIRNVNVTSSWTEVYNFQTNEPARGYQQSTWYRLRLNLTDVAIGNGISMDESFEIRWMQYGTYSFYQDGYVIDNVHVFQGVWDVSETPAPAPPSLSTTADIYSDSFEGYPIDKLNTTNYSQWSLGSRHVGRAAIFADGNARAQDGSQFLVLDGGLTELVLSLDLRNYSDTSGNSNAAILTFWWTRFVNEQHVEDRICIRNSLTMNEDEWITVFTFDSASEFSVWYYTEIDLSHASQARGMAMDENFQIKFSEQGGQFYPTGNAYIIDTVHVYEATPFGPYIATFPYYQNFDAFEENPDWPPSGPWSTGEANLGQIGVMPYGLAGGMCLGLSRFKKFSSYEENFIVEIVLSIDLSAAPQGAIVLSFDWSSHGHHYNHYQQHVSIRDGTNNAAEWEIIYYLDTRYILDYSWISAEIDLSHHASFHQIDLSDRFQIRWSLPSDWGLYEQHQDGILIENVKIDAGTSDDHVKIPFSENFDGFYQVYSWIPQLPWEMTHESNGSLSIRGTGAEDTYSALYFDTTNTSQYQLSEVVLPLDLTGFNVPTGATTVILEFWFYLSGDDPSDGIYGRTNGNLQWNHIFSFVEHYCLSGWYFARLNLLTSLDDAGVVLDDFVDVKFSHFGNSLTFKIDQLEIHEGDARHRVEIPFFEDFEKYCESNNWDVNANLHWSSGDLHNGSFGILDNEGNSYSTGLALGSGDYLITDQINELVLSLDLGSIGSESSLLLDFWYKTYSRNIEEAQIHDWVYIRDGSNDQNVWFPIFALTNVSSSALNNEVVELRQAAQDVGVVLNQDFEIMFVHWGCASADRSCGLFLDDVRVHEVYTPSVTAVPTAYPTAPPTQNPTLAPTSTPTSTPTADPTSDHTLDSTLDPTSTPTSTLTSTPTYTDTTDTPTVSSTDSPSMSSTDYPTVDTTNSPTVTATDAPTMSTTDTPTVGTTDTPAVGATDSPTVGTTDFPTVGTTDTPTAVPYDSTVSPTYMPSVAPAYIPTDTPTGNPTMSATDTPTVGTTDTPTVGTTGPPTVDTTDSPTVGITDTPTVVPYGSTVTPTPTYMPSVAPAYIPTDTPTPTYMPSVSSTNIPGIEEEDDEVNRAIWNPGSLILSLLVSLICVIMLIYQ